MPLLTTGCAALDRILGGGIPAHSVTFLLGEPGTGKTLFALQTLFHLARRGKKCLYLTTLAEPSLKLVHDMQQFDFFEEALVDRGVVFADLGTVLRGSGADATVQAIMDRVERETPEVVVVDSFKVVLELVPDPAAARMLFYDLSVNLVARGATSFFVAEHGPGESDGQPELAIADGILRFVRRRVGRAAVREIEVVKLRGADYLGGLHSFEIGPEGLTFYPRLAAPAGLLAGTGAIFGERIASGVPGLDAMLGGGLLRGAQTAVRGGPGTGKTLLGLELLFEGARQSEAGIHVSLEETPEQLRAMAASLGRDLPEREEQGLITLCHLSPIELSGDRFLHELTAMVERTHARRVVLDSLSSLGMASPRATRLVCALAEHLRSRGVTSLFSADRPSGADFALDNLIHLEHAPPDRRVRVLKARATRHSTDVRPLIILPHGLEVTGHAA